MAGKPWKPGDREAQRALPPGLGAPYAKGQSGNPGGRPSYGKACLVATGKTQAEVLAEMVKILYAAATGGDVRSARDLADRLGGKPAQVIDLNMGDTARPIDVSTLTDEQLSALAAIPVPDDAPTEH